MIQTAYASGSVHAGAESNLAVAAGSQTVSFSASGSTNWAVIGDAIVASVDNGASGLSLSFDGKADTYSGSASSVSVALTTANSPDVIVAACGTGHTSSVTFAVSDADGLVWHTRLSQYTGDGTFASIYEAYAIAPTPLSSDTITCSMGTVTDNLDLIVFGISGANTNFPWDPNPTLPATKYNDASSSESVPISTNNVNDMILGLLIAQSTTLTVGSHYTAIETGIGQSPKLSAEYQIVSSTKSSFNVDWSSSTSVSWLIDGDAIVQASSSNPPSLLYTTYSSYDNWGNTISTTDAIGHTTFYSYANKNSYNTFIGAGNSFTNSFYTNNTVISSHVHDALVGEAQLQNGAGSAQQETYYDYTAAAEVLHQKQLFINGTNDVWLYTSSNYDFYGNALTSTDALGRTVTYQYSSTYGNAYLTNQSIVVTGKTISQTYAYNFGTGWLTSQTNGNGQTTSYTYDNLGRILYVNYPAIAGVSAFTQYSYNDNKNTVNITDPDGNLAVEYFDGLGRQIEVQTFNGSQPYSTEYYTYNWQNQVANHTTPAGKTYSYFYDALGRQTEVINPDGTKEFTLNDAMLNSTMYEVNQMDENGHSTFSFYNWANQLEAVKQFPQPGITYITKYTYDQVGNLLTSTDAKNQVTTYQYDNLNRLTMAKYPDGTNSTNTYDIVGNLVRTKDPIGNVITNTYDVLNRLTQVTYPNGATVSYTYDADGNKLSMVQSSPATSSYYSYDPRGRLTNQTERIAGASYTTLYSYDKASNILSITYPDRAFVNMTYDVLNRIKTLGTIANFTYTLDNKIATIGYGNNVKTTYTYDSRDRPKSIYSFTGSTQLMGLNYTYDAVGNVIGINTETFTYNSINELISSNGPWGSTAYSYDGAGDMVNMTQGGSTTSYGYDSYNRMTSAGSVSLTYDPNGNLVKIVNGSTTWQYNYNYLNELTGAVKNGVTVQNDTYNGDGNRVEQVAGGSSIVYTYQGVNILYEKNLTSSIASKNYYANGLLLGENVGGTTYYLLDDALGSIRDVTTTSPVSTVFSSDYKPYGLNYGLSQTVSILNFEFNHKPYDTSTGFYYYGARYFDPSLARFITEDSTQYSNIQDPLSLNRYAYAENNPETGIDPTGNMLVYGYHWYDPSAQTPTPTTPPAPAPAVPTTPPQAPPPSPPPSTTPSRYYVSNYRISHMMQAQNNFDSQQGGNGQSQTTTSNSKMSFQDWFVSVYGPQHIASILAGIASVVLAFLGPAVIGILGGKDAITTVVASLVGFSIAGDFLSLGKDLASRDIAGVEGDLVALGYDAIKAIWKDLNPGQLIRIAVVESLWSLGSWGWGDVVDALSGVTAAAIFGGTLTADAYYSYNYNYHP